MRIDLSSVIIWMSQPTPEAFLACVGFCFLPVIGLPVFPAIFRAILVRGAILALWEQDRRIWELRQNFERRGILVEPVISSQRCPCARTRRGSPMGYLMALECDLMRKQKLPFRGILTRCASCGRTPDLTPGETLQELAVRFQVPLPDLS